MATAEQIREGLATNLSTITGIQVSAYMLGSPTPPAIHIIPGAIEYDQAMQRGLDVPNYTVEAFVALGTDIGAQKLLDELRAPTGSRSVKTALETDKTLGGIVDTLHIPRSTEPQVLTLGDRQLLSVAWEVVVYDTP